MSGLPGAAKLSFAPADEGIDCEPLKAYREALDKVAIVAITDVRGRIVNVNQKFCAISGYTADELIGATHALLNSGHHPRSFFDDMWRTISSGRSWRADICNRAKSGRLYWVDTTITPLRDTIGRLQGYVSIRFDVTDRKVAQEKAEIEYLRRQDSETLLAGLINTLPADGTNSGDAADASTRGAD